MNGFTSSDIKKRFPGAIERTYANGQVVIYDGDSPNFVRFIQSGAVKFYDTDENGNDTIMHISGDGSIFPLFYSFENKKQVDGFYATISKTKVVMIPLAEFRAELKKSAEYAFQTLQWYANEMDHLVLRLKSMEKGSAKKRILQALLYLCDQHSLPTKYGKWHRIAFPITQQTLAELTGLTRETVNITLKSPEAKHLVSNRRQKFDIDRDAVEKLLSS